MQRTCTGKHRHVRVGANNVSEKVDTSGTWVRGVARATEEQLRADEQELEVWEQKKQSNGAKRMRGVVHDNDKNKGTHHLQYEMGKFMRHDEQAVFSLWHGVHWDGTKGGWLDPELCAKARRDEVEYILRHMMYTRQDGWRLPRDSRGSPMCARGG